MRQQMEEMQATIEELLKRLYEKIQQKFTENDYREMASIVPRSGSSVQVVRTVDPRDVEGEISDNKQGK